MARPPETMVLAPPVLRNVDYRSTVDDAWYAVRLAVEDAQDGTALRVKYIKFSPELDKLYKTKGFSGPGEVEALRERFRASSVKLQGWQCRRVAEGMKVCASHVFGKDDLWFYDAVVYSVIRAKHSVVNGDVCNCRFILIWQHGPLVGQQTSVSAQQICIVQSRSPHNPTLDTFLGIVSAGHTETTATNEEHTSKKHDERILDHSKPNDTAKRPSNHMKFERTQPTKRPRTSVGLKTTTTSEEHIGKKHDERIMDHSKPNDTAKRPSNHMKFERPQPTKRPRTSVGLKRSPQPTYYDRSSPKPKKNGGTYYSLWVDNLEKDVSHITISDYLYEQTSIPCHVKLSHCSVPTMCYGGSIFVKHERDAKKLLNFLHDPAHIVVSSRGRPWLIKEDWCQVVEGTLPRNEINRSNEAQQGSSKLRLVYKGTREYERAKDVQALRLDFHNRIEHLRRTLDSEERKIMLQRGGPSWRDGKWYQILI